MGFFGMLGLAAMSGLVFFTVLGLVVSRGSSGSTARSNASASQSIAANTSESTASPMTSDEPKSPRRKSLLLQLVEASDRQESASTAACRQWFDHRPNLGSALSVEDLPDWACGTRRTVETDKGSYLCYLKDTKVVTIWHVTGDDRVAVFRAPNSECSGQTILNQTRAAVGDVPGYKVVDMVAQQLGGRRVGGQNISVIVGKLQPTTPEAEMERVAGEIARREDATGPGDHVYVYCSDAALKADRSEIFKKQHPNAVSCNLGAFYDGAFHRL